MYGTWLVKNSKAINRILLKVRNKSDSKYKIAKVKCREIYDANLKIAKLTCRENFM